MLSRERLEGVEKLRRAIPFSKRWKKMARSHLEALDEIDRLKKKVKKCEEEIDDIAEQLVDFSE